MRGRVRQTELVIATERWAGWLLPHLASLVILGTDGMDGGREKGF